MNPTWDELVWSADHERAAISRAADRGNLRRLGVGLYPALAAQDLETVARRRVWDIVARVFPGAVVVDRSARAGGIGSSNELLLAHARRGSFAVPGFTIVPRPGAGPTQGDIPLPNGLFSPRRRGRCWRVWPNRAATVCNANNNMTLIQRY